MAAVRRLPDDGAQDSLRALTGLPTTPALACRREVEADVMQL